MTINLYIYCYQISVEYRDEKLLQSLKRDFAYFLKPRYSIKKRTRIYIERRYPDFTTVRGFYLFTHLLADVYGWGDFRWLKYKNGLVYFDSRNSVGRVISKEEDFLYHYTYYLIISKIGEILDLNGLHRFHSLAVEICGTTVLFSMPINGGKTTLGMLLMKHDEVSLFSEDTPLIDRHGKVNPFPMRLSLRPGFQFPVPKKLQRIKDDPVFGKKILVDLDYLGIENIKVKSGKPSYIFWGTKSKLKQPALQKINPLLSLLLVIVYMVMGKDCPQRAEFFLRLSPKGFLMIGVIFLKRFLTALSLWKNTRSYYFHMTSQVEINAAFIKNYISSSKYQSKKG